MEVNPNPDHSKRNLIAIVAVMALAILAYRYLNNNNFSQTSFLFVGLPALISIAIIKFSKPTSGYGIMYKVITLFLLISGMFLGEGIACIIFAAPIFYGVGILLVAINNYLNRKEKDKLYVWVAIPVLLFLGDVSDYYDQANLQTVEVTKIVTEEVALSNFDRQNILDNKLPDFFSLGFPLPVQIEGSGIEVGAQRTIDFKSQTKGLGTLVLEVVELGPNRIVFQNQSDNTHIHRWLDWQNIEVTIDRNNENNIITWRSSYYCELGPSWYFEPLEKFAVRKSSKFLLDAYFGNNERSSNIH